MARQKGKLTWLGAVWRYSIRASLVVVVIVMSSLAMTSTYRAYADSRNTRADHWGTLELAGSAWLNGSGVNVYSNGPSVLGPAKDTYNCVSIAGGAGGQGCPAGSVPSGIEWQCVELINRLYLTKGWIRATWYGDGDTLVNRVPAGLTKENQGAISYLNPGDVITLYSDARYANGALINPWGHAAVVDSVSGNTVRIVNQNTQQVYSTAILSGHTLTMEGWNGYKVQAVIHHPTSSGSSQPSHQGQPAFYAGTIVQWNGDTKTQKTAWLVSPDLKRYWIPDSSTFNCLLSDGFTFSGPLSGTLLNQMPDQTGQWASCGGSSLGVNQFLFRGGSLRSGNGEYHLELQRSDGNLVLYGPSGALWATSVASDFLVMQGDSNLVTYRYGAGGTVATWATNTANSKANTLVVQDDGNLVLYAPNGVAIWDRHAGTLTTTPTATSVPASTSVPLSSYVGKIVQWNGDTKTQKTSWYVSPDLKRYWIPDSSTYNCLVSRGATLAGALSGTVLNQLPDQVGYHAACGSDSLSVNQFLFRGSYLRSSNGEYHLELQRSDGNLVLYGPSGALWATSVASDFLVMQGDSNLVTYRYGAGGTVATWATNSPGTGANTLVVQDDGNLVLYAPGGVPIWDRYSGLLK